MAFLGKWHIKNCGVGFGQDLADVHEKEHDVYGRKIQQNYSESKNSKK